MASKDKQIKTRVVDQIKTFRGLAFLSDSEVKINDLETTGDTYLLKGEYDCTSIFGATIEKGTFEISLNRQNLEPVKTKVNPIKA